MKSQQPTLLVRSISEESDDNRFTALVSIVDNGSMVVIDTKVLCDKKLKVASSAHIPEQYLKFIYTELTKQQLIDSMT